MGSYKSTNRFAKLCSNESTHRCAIVTAIFRAYMGPYEPTHRSANMGSYQSAHGSAIIFAYIRSYLGSNKPTHGDTIKCPIQYPNLYTISITYI